MTFEEVVKSLPNGFHDARARKIIVDYESRSITMEMELLVGMPGTPNRESYQPGTLTVAPFGFFILEPPDPSYDFVPDGKPLHIMGDSTRTAQSPTFDSLMATLPKKVDSYRFFIEEWNSFLYIAGESVAFSWCDRG
jgi:hypothetical protein